MSDLQARFLSAADRFQGVLQVLLAGTHDKAKLQALEQELLAQQSSALIETFCTIRFLPQYGQYLAAYVLTPRPIARAGQPLAAQAMAAWTELLRELGGEHNGWETLLARLLKRPAAQGWEWRPSGEWALGCDPKAASWLVQHPNLFRFAAELLAVDALAKSKRPPTASQKAKRKGKGVDLRDKEQLLLAALCEHHRYKDGSVLNQEPLAVRELARMTRIARSTVSRFFQRRFSGHKRYVRYCRSASDLATQFRLLRGEIGLHTLTNFDQIPDRD